ncbi:MAG TPA: hypothetical protein VKP30_14755 [Polyangiaceae bacterium]|nr:hypothetical protein [Polyangiaceae bacterium]
MVLASGVSNRKRRAKRTACLAFFGAIATLVDCAALANDSARDRAAAKAHYQEASAKYVRREYVQACALFAESFRLVPAYAPLFGIAKCQEEVEGNLVAAQSSYERARTLTAQSQDHEELDRRIAELEARIPRISVRAPTLIGGTAGVQVYQNENVVTEAGLGESLRLNPGSYRIVVTTTDGRREVTTEVTLKEAERRTVDVTFAPESVEPPNAGTGTSKQSPPAPVSVEMNAGISDRRHVAYLVGGTAFVAAGALLLADGVRLGIKMHSKVNEMDQPELEDASYNRLRREAIDLRQSAVVLDVIGGAAVIAGTLGILSYFRAFPFASGHSTRSAKSSWVGTAISPTGVHVFGGW